MTEDELIRFHNGDTLHNIPVIRLPLPSPQKRQIRTRMAVVAVGSAALVGAAIGLVAGAGTHVGATTGPSPAPPRTTPSPSAPPTPAPTVTMWQVQPIETRPVIPDSHPYQDPYEGVEMVQVIQAPATGGDPGMDYCLSYAALGDPGSDDNSDGIPEARLLVNAYSYECQDFLFSTHPRDGLGVWEEETPPDCSDTPDARLAYISFDIATTWYGGDAYTCLLTNDGT